MSAREVRRGKVKEKEVGKRKGHDKIVGNEETESGAGEGK